MFLVDNFLTSKRTVRAEDPPQQPEGVLVEVSTLEEVTFMEVSSVVGIKVVLAITEGVVSTVVEVVVFMGAMVLREDMEAMDLMEVLALAATIMVVMVMAMVVEDMRQGTITIDLPLVDLMMPGANYLLAMCVSLKYLFISKLPYTTRWQELKDLFAAAGPVIRADILLTPDGRSKGSGVVVFETKEAAQDAIKRFDGMEMSNRQIMVREDRYV